MNLLDFLRSVKATPTLIETGERPESFLGSSSLINHDYELIGFDGAPISEQAIYPISTVGQQIDQIADEAVSLLVSQMQERKKRHPVPLAEPVHKTVPPLLIRRQTTT